MEPSVCKNAKEVTVVGYDRDAEKVEEQCQNRKEERKQLFQSYNIHLGERVRREKAWGERGGSCVGGSGRDSRKKRRSGRVKKKVRTAGCSRETGIADLRRGGPRRWGGGKEAGLITLTADSREGWLGPEGKNKELV